MRLKTAHQNLRSYAFTYGGSATVGNLCDAVCRRLLLDEARHFLWSPIFDAELPRAALIADVQLLHGVELHLRRTDQRQGEPVALPALSQDDSLRLVHEIGCQLGFAWPLSESESLLTWALDWDSVSLLCSQRSDAPIVQAQLKSSSILTISGAGTLVEFAVNGHPYDGVFDVAAGSLVEIRHPEDNLSIRLRVLARNEHEAVRDLNHSTPYRVVARSVVPTSIEPHRLQLEAPPRLDRKSLDPLELFFQEAPTVGLYGFMLMRTGFSPIALVFLFLPAGRIGYRLYRHFKARQESREALDEWRRRTQRELGTLQAQAFREADALRDRNVKSEHLITAALFREEGLWQIRPTEPAFLELAVGNGEYVSDSTVTIRGNVTDGDLEDWRQHFDEARHVADVPIVVDVLGANLALVGSSDRVHEALRGHLLRLALLHSPASLAMAAFLPFDDVELDKLAWIRWLPHFQSVSSLFIGPRLLHGAARTQTALRQNIELLADGAPGSDHILILIHEAAGVSLGLLQRYLDHGRGRVHLVWIGTSRSRVPEQIRRLIDVGEDDKQGATGRLLPDLRELELQSIGEDVLEEATASLAPLADESALAVSGVVAVTMSLAGLIGHTAEGLVAGVRRQWDQNRTVGELRASIGEGASGLFEVDLVEHGPHLLVGGTTESGKSELLRSMLISYACRYAPRELAMLFIDFKGGAALSDLSQLPHAVGTVSNLEPQDVIRLIEFLDEEINRRQQLLRSYQGDFDTFRVSNQLPRLLVVVDEFAGFLGDKRQHEAAIVNIAARGRSLGIHLVLATQRPRSAIGGEIAANVNARLCLRTLDPHDSISVIDTPDAYLIPRGLPGRCFARLESGQSLEFQSAYSGSRDFLARFASTGISIEEFDPVRRTERSGLIVTGGRRQSEPDDLKVVVDALSPSSFTDLNEYRFSEEEQKRLAPSLTESVGQRPPGVVRAALEPFLGVRDNPRRQRQGPYSINLATGSFLVAGESRSGKTSILSSIARQMAMSNPGAQIISLDCGGGDLDLEIGKLASWRMVELNTGAASFMVEQLTGIVAESDRNPDIYAPIVLVIDRLDIFVEAFRDLVDVIRLVATGARRGVYVVSSTDPRLEVDRALLRAFRWRFTLQRHLQGRLTDEAGMATQAYLAPRRLDVEEVLARAGDNNGSQRRVRRAVGFPSAAQVESPSSAGAFYLGIDEMRHRDVTVSLGRGFAIAGPARSGRTTALLSIAERLASVFPTIRVPFIAPYQIPGHTAPYLEEVLPVLRDGTVAEAQEYLRTLWAVPHPRVLFIDDFDRLRYNLPDFGANASGSLHIGLGQAVERMGVTVVAAGPMSILEASEAWSSRLSYSARNFLVLMPGDTSTVSNRAFGVEYGRMVRPRSGRGYQPGEGVLVDRRGRSDVRVVRSETASSVAQIAHISASVDL